MKRIVRKYFQKLPPKSKSVTRPGRWGNPYKVIEEGDLFFVENKDGLQFPTDGFETKLSAVKLSIVFFRIYLKSKLEAKELDLSYFDGIENIACFCKLGEPCHSEVIIEFVNEYRKNK